jgi:valyl-tRNA synthetase
VEDCDAALEAYRLHEYAETAYHFVWGEFCDWYLELVKPRLYGDRGADSRDAAACCLAHVLFGWLRLLHPVMPFVTDTLALRIPGVGDRETIMMGPWPRPPGRWSDPEAEKRMGELQELIGAVRNLRSEYNVQQGARVEVVLGAISETLSRALDEETEGLRRLAGVEAVREDGTEGVGPGGHAVLRSGTEVFVPLADVIDLDRERERLADEIERVESLLGSTRERLANQDFLVKAPSEVVAREREKESSLEQQRQRLAAKREALAGSGGA